MRSALIGSPPGRAAGACAVGAAVPRCDPRGHGGGGGAAAGAAGRGGGWRPGAVAVGAVLLAGPVALHPLRPGALRGHLPAALRAPGPGQPPPGSGCARARVSPAARGGPALSGAGRPRAGAGSHPAFGRAVARRRCPEAPAPGGRRGGGRPGGDRREGSSCGRQLDGPCLAGVPTGDPRGRAWGRVLPGRGAGTWQRLRLCSPGASQQPSLKRPGKHKYLRRNGKVIPTNRQLDLPFFKQKNTVSVLGSESTLDASLMFAVSSKGL